MSKNCEWSKTESSIRIQFILMTCLFTLNEITKNYLYRSTRLSTSIETAIRWVKFALNLVFGIRFFHFKYSFRKFPICIQRVQYLPYSSSRKIAIRPKRTDLRHILYLRSLINNTCHRGLIEK